MRKLILPLFIVASTLYLSSCHCGGSDQIVSTTGIKITTPSTYSAASSMPAIEIQEVTETRKGDRKCMYKNLITSFENSLLTNTVKVYTDKELKLYNLTIPAGANLLQYKQLNMPAYDSSLRNFSQCAIYFSNLIDTSTIKGQYRFYVHGTTDRNITYADSSDMVIQ